MCKRINCGWFKVKLNQPIFDENGEQIMDIDDKLAKVDGAAENDGVNETKESSEMDDEERNSEEMDENEYEVEKILDVAIIDGEIKFQIRWKDYGSDDDSWEPKENLETAQKILDEYIASNREKMEKVQAALLAQNKYRKLGRRRRMMLENKGKKGSRRSVSLEKVKVEDKWKSQANKRMKIEFESDVPCSGDCDDDDDDCFLESFQKNDAKPQTRKSTASEKDALAQKPLQKQFTPKKSKNAWLYDDLDDADSDVSEQKSRMKKKIDGRKQSGSSRPVVNVTAKNDRSPRALVEMQCDSDSNIISKSEEKNKGTSRKKTKDRQVMRESAQKRRIGSDELPEPKVEIIGLVQCGDGAVKVIYKKAGEVRPHVVSVKEAFEIDGYGLVQYLICRCEFGKPHLPQK